jgi:hypothetical protein
VCQENKQFTISLPPPSFRGLGVDVCKVRLPEEQTACDGRMGPIILVVFQTAGHYLPSAPPIISLGDVLFFPARQSVTAKGSNTGLIWYSSLFEGQRKGV